MTATTKNYYEILGVSRDASQKDIERAFRKLAKKYHPDANPDDEAAAKRFKEINEAYQVLRDPEKRKEYDNPQPDWQTIFSRNGGPGTHFEYRTTVDPEELRDLLGGFGGFGSTGRVFDLGDLLGHATDRTTARSPWTTTQSLSGRDVTAELPLSLEEAHRGGRRMVSVNGKRLEVSVPAGVRDGTTIRLAGQGEPGAGGGKPGDLLLTVKLLPHPRFQVRGDDLETELKLTPWEAVLGTTAPVRTLDGKVSVTIPPRSQSGKKLRLRGQGLNRRSGGRGDLFVKLVVVVPTRPTREEERLFRELARVSTFTPRRDH